MELKAICFTLQNLEFNITDTKRSIGWNEKKRNEYEYGTTEYLLYDTRLQEQKDFLNTLQGLYEKLKTDLKNFEKFM